MPASQSAAKQRGRSKKSVTPSKKDKHQSPAKSSKSKSPAKSQKTGKKAAKEEPKVRSKSRPTTTEKKAGKAGKEEAKRRSKSRNSAAGSKGKSRGTGSKSLKKLSKDVKDLKDLKKKAKRVKDETKPTRPGSAYLAFTTEQIPLLRQDPKYKGDGPKWGNVIKEDGTEWKHTDFMVLAGKLWGALTDKERVKYDTIAADEKARHAENLAVWEKKGYYIMADGTRSDKNSKKEKKEAESSDEDSEPVAKKTSKQIKKSIVSAKKE
jgi:hypothetical protein